MNSGANLIPMDGPAEDDQLSPVDRLMLLEVFAKPVSSETIFLLINLLRLSSPTVIQRIFKLYLEFLSDSAASKISKPPEVRISHGIYLCMILRFKPVLSNIYIQKQHFLMVGWKAFYPYISMFIVYFLLPCIISGANIEEDLREISPPNDQGSKPNGNQAIVVSATGNRPIDPVRQFPNFSNQAMAQMNAMRERVGSPAIYHSESSPPEQRSAESRSAEGSPPLQMPVITKMIEICGLNSPERKTLGELRRIHTSGPNYYFSRLGLKMQKTELAIFLDIQSLLDEPLTEDDVQKAIFMHSNTVLRSDGVFLPHHFDRSVSCLNYEMARHTFGMADWIRTETFDELVFLSKELKHAVCLELLLLAVQKNMILCRHHLKRIPSSWRERVLQVYTEPRWRNVKLPPKPAPAGTSNPKVETAKPSQDIKPVGEELGINSTLEYYRTTLGFNGSYHELVEVLPAVSSKLQSDAEVNDFLDKLRLANQSFYILEVSGYLDFYAEKKLTFANLQDIIGDDIFDLPKNFIFPYREGEFLYLFDYNTFENILKTKKNPYNRSPIRDEAIEAMLDKFQRFNVLGLSNKCVGMADFVKEMVYGRTVEQNCPCGSSKDYVKKLARALRSYSVKVESFEVVNLQDALFKLSLMSFDFQANSIPQLCEVLYTAIKTAETKDREQLKQAIASVILIYSKYSGSSFLVGF